jgi:hypothetical protein
VQLLGKWRRSALPLNGGAANVSIRPER